MKFFVFISFLFLLWLTNFTLLGQENSTNNSEKKIISDNKSVSKEESLFWLLSCENDSIALNAFTQLTTCSPQKIFQLANEFEKKAS